MFFFISQDGNAGTHNFLTSPELAVAFAFSGDLNYNPQTDSVSDFKFQPPVGKSLPTTFAQRNFF